MPKIDRERLRALAAQAPFQAGAYEHEGARFQYVGDYIGGEIDCKEIVEVLNMLPPLLSLLEAIQPQDPDNLQIAAGIVRSCPSIGMAAGRELEVIAESLERLQALCKKLEAP